MSNTQLGALFFLSVVVILLTCRLVGWVLRALGQPPVVGEMVAGVVLGPSVLGLLLPSVEASLFPPQLRPVLYVVGHIGLVVFMFQAGFEFQPSRLKRIAGSASAISVAGVAVPMLLGAGLTVVADGLVDIFPDGVSLLVSALFVGVSLAITAFPMLARIITERGLTNTHFGSMSLACGALDDAVAWVMLAAVLSIAAGSTGPFLLVLGGTAGLILVLALMSRANGRLAALAARVQPENLVLVLVIGLFLASWYTDVIGLYAVFGAFSLGVAFPRSAAIEAAVHTLRPVGAVLLPLFFTYSGLNTNFALLFRPDLLLFTLACVLAAIAGKFGACWLAARLTGEPPEVAIRVGTLMNARGLMQLIAINVGLAAGIVTPALFSALVVVALVTTMMATPMLSFWDRRDRRRGVVPEVDRQAAEASVR